MFFISCDCASFVIVNIMTVTNIWCVSFFKLCLVLCSNQSFHLGLLNWQCACADITNNHIWQWHTILDNIYFIIIYVACYLYGLKYCIIWWLI